AATKASAASEPTRRAAMRESYSAGLPPGHGIKAPMRRVRPLEAVQLIYMAALAVMTLLLWGRLTHPWATLGPLAVMAAVVVVMGWLAAREDRLPALWKVVVNFYPTVLLPLVFNALGPLIEALRGGPRDDLLIAADRALFG